MHSRGLLAVAVVLFGCESQSLLGTWQGSLAVNDGRMATTANGTLVITTGAGIPAAYDLKFSGAVMGATTTFTCASPLSTASATASTASLAVPATCRLTATPDDGCTRELTVTAGELTVAGLTLTGTGNGRLSTSCPAMSSTSIDVGLTLNATKR